MLFSTIFKPLSIFFGYIELYIPKLRQNSEPYMMASFSFSPVFIYILVGDAFVIFILLASLNSCCNPWIYMAFSGNLIQQFIPCCKKRVGKWSKSNTNENKLEHNVGFARQRLKVLSNKNKRFERRSSSLTSFGSTLRGSKAGSDDINHMSNYTRSTSASEHLFSGHVRPDAQQVNRPDERQSLLKKQTANAFYPVDV